MWVYSCMTHACKSCRGARRRSVRRDLPPVRVSPFRCFTVDTHICFRDGAVTLKLHSGCCLSVDDLSNPLKGVSMAQALQAAQLQRVMTGDKQYPKPPDFHPSYGTAGFRSVADRLPSTVYRYFPLIHRPILLVLCHSCGTRRGCSFSSCFRDVKPHPDC